MGSGKGAGMHANQARPTAKTDVTGHGDPLVLVPGGLTGWRSWAAHAERLAQRRRVIRTQLLSVELGLRGEPLPPGYGLETESEALLRALDELGVAQADVVAWSYGGAIALGLALDRPERVRSLTLIEPAAYWVLRGFGRFGPEAQAVEREMRALGPGAISEEQLAYFLFVAGIVPEGADPRASPQWPVWLEHRQSLRIGDAPFRHQDDVARLKTFDRPVLLFKGEGSPDYVREVVDLLGRALPDARVEELPGAHVLQIVSVEAFLAILSDFLEGRAA